MTDIAYIRRDLSIVWSDTPASDGRLITSCGDLILNVYDIWDPSDVYEYRTIERWANRWELSLDGIPVPDAVHCMLLAFVLPALTELVPGYADIVQALRAMEVTEQELAYAGLEVPCFPVRIDGHVARTFLADWFDGPFDDLDEQLAAVQRRSTVHA